MRTFLIGGGRQAGAVHDAFVRAANGPVVAFVLDEGADTDPQRWAKKLAEAGATDHRIVIVSPDRPASAADLRGAAAVYVAGGLTPGYHQALVAGGTGWLDEARDAGLVYGGFSAGAAIAAAHALVGGARVNYRGRAIEVIDEDFNEELSMLTVLPGLGLVPFTVDVHAAQWGTLNRLVHALVATKVTEGWAIDENTALEVAEGMVTVHGSGAATRVLSQGPDISLTVHVAGDQIIV
ncbi:MAG: Type 1 glutamine amidotransferase-like domain-containing protein [Actinomycetota bacterium]